jgi:hypothetical protein
MLGRYEILEPFGHGGMATIYLARQREPARMVALKLVKEEFAARPEYEDMFRDEAKILSRLRHPNIVETLEADVAGGRPFIAMELLPGRSVEDLCDACARRKGRFPLYLAAWIGARVADAFCSSPRARDARTRPRRTGRVRRQSVDCSTVRARQDCAADDGAWRTGAMLQTAQAAGPSPALSFERIFMTRFLEGCALRRCRTKR